MEQLNTNTIIRTFQQLSLKKRIIIATLYLLGWSARKIAKQINVHHSTVSRELKRNSTVVVYVNPSTKKYEDQFITKTEYIPEKAHDKAMANKKFCGMYPTKFLPDYIIKEIEFLIIKKHWSPEIVLGRLKVKYPDVNFICIKTLYDWIYADVLKVKAKHLERKGERRKRKTKETKSQKTIGKPIDLRPEHINNRSEFGHFEGDSVIGAKQKGQIITLVERMTRMAFVFKFANKCMKNIVTALIYLKNMFKSKFNKVFKSITFDNGSEFWSWEEIEQLLNIDTYFAHPFKSCERGTNEHFNGRLRKYIPKKTYFKNVTDEYLQQSCNEINERPLKLLKFKTPKEAFNEQISMLN